MDAVVARVGKAHGLRGEVTVQVHTDSPEERLRPGAELGVQPPAGSDDARLPATLTVVGVRVHNGIWLVAFDGYADRTAAESLRGVRLTVPEDEDDEPDAWYESDLRGLTVRDPGGATIGEVTGLEVGAAQDRLVVRLGDGRTGRVPFVAALVPVVDVPGGYVVVDAPDGLFDLEPGPGRV